MNSRILDEYSDRIKLFLWTCLDHDAKRQVNIEVRHWMLWLKTNKELSPRKLYLKKKENANKHI